MNKFPLKSNFAVVIILVIFLFFKVEKTFAYPIYQSNPNLVIVAPYDTVTSGTANSGCSHACDSGGRREFIAVGQKYRIRQAGTISKIRLYVANINNLTGFYIKIWRKNGTTYDLVGQSNNIAGSLVGSSINSIDLSTAISGVQEGDYYGYLIEASGAEYELSSKSATGVISYYVDNIATSDNDYDWESKMAIANIGQPIELYMTAPQFAFIGDSVMAGHPGNYSFIETNNITNLNCSIEKQFSNLTGYTYQNMGIGSQTTSMISARFINDIVNLKPKVAVIYGSSNDGYLDANKATFLVNWKNMLDAAQSSEYINNIIVLKLLPFTIGSTAQLRVHDDWNQSLEALATGYSKVIFIDANPYVGQFRPGGDVGNLWDIKPVFDQDGVHYTQAGYTQIAQVIANTLDNLGYYKFSRILPNWLHLAGSNIDVNSDNIVNSKDLGIAMSMWNMP